MWFPSGRLQSLSLPKVNRQLNTAIRERSRILELQDRLKEWLLE
jgi:hypothetical protein